ncbi:MAG: hypothetical protein R3C32_02095 [Chloroflexota bacterium]
MSVTQLGLGGASYGELFHRVAEAESFGALRLPGTAASATSTPRRGTGAAVGAAYRRRAARSPA